MENIMKLYINLYINAITDEDDEEYDDDLYYDVNTKN